MKKIYALFILSMFFHLSYAQTYHSLVTQPFIQNWANVNLITANDNWTGVPSIQGFLGQDITTRTASNPDTLSTVSALANDLDVIANQSNPALTAGGVAEFDRLADPTIALQGSGTADAPNLIIFLNTTGVNSVSVQYNLRDIDTTADNAIQPVALQYRIGNTGNFINIPAAYIADASSGPGIATLITAVDVVLPAACNNQAQLQLRIITANAAGSDEWIGIDDIKITASKSFSLSGFSNASEPGTNGAFTFSFSPATTVATTFNYSFLQEITGSARFGVDYTVSFTTGDNTASIQSREGSLTVPASTASVTFTIIPVDDAISEGVEYIQLTISDPSDGYSTGTDKGSINLSDNEAALTVSVSAGSNLSEPSTDGNFKITLSSPAPAGGITVNYSLSGQAAINTDYDDPQAGTITIGEGLTTGNITLKPIDDLLIEGPEAISIVVNGVTGGFAVGNATASINLSDNDFPKIVINEIYGGGGNSGATFKNDFIELYNNSASPVSLSGWSVQYASAGGSSWQKTNLTDTIPAFGYYLIQQATGTGGTVSLPTPDDIGTIAMAAGAGKIALVSNTTFLTGTCPTGAHIIDFVGFGSTASCFEGSGAAAAPSNTTSIQRSNNGFDSNNNASDFITAMPAPRNSVPDITAPLISSAYPVNGSVNAGTAFVATLNFNEAVTKGTGNIILKSAGGNTIQTFNVNSTGLMLSGSNVSFLLQGLAFNTTYYFEIEKGSFKDLDGNLFEGISGKASWSFTTGNMPVGAMGTTYNFNNCTSALSDGFNFYSVIGAQVWNCTAFGIDATRSPAGSAPNGVQINGFSGTNLENEDWLISPSFDLTGSTYPLLSFWSRTRFNGLPLQLKVSTDYPGTGDPRNFTWTDLNGKFPAQTSDVWTLSSNINLSAFKGTNVHFAFVYFSSEDDGARWTVDDISITNSATPPPPNLTISATDIKFPYVASGSTTEKSFSFTGNDLVEDVRLSATGEFLLSKDGSSFSTSLNYTAAEANNISKTVYLRFIPTSKNQNFTGTVLINTSDIRDTVSLNGTSIDPATTLEVVNWNIEWFGSKGFGPTNEDQQEQNVLAILKNVNADIYGLVEVVDENRLARVVRQMNGYDYVIGNFGSHVNPPSQTGGSLADAQKLAFVYKTSVFANVTARPFINNQNTGSSSYNNWASGRYPFLMTADVMLNCVTKKMSFILIHAKANTSPTTTSYARRQAAAVELHDSLETYFADANVIVLGDFNDDLDKTITDGINPPYSSYKVFTDDQNDFFSPTLSLSLAGKKSTVSYNDVIDHVMLTNDIAPYYMPGTASILSDAAGLVNNYASTTSDHYPVFTRYQFEQPAAPVVTTCPVVAPVCATVAGTYVIPDFTATSSCGALSYSFVISGATKRTGESNDASGAFNAGTSIITWTATDASGQTSSCQSTVVINSKPLITIPDAYALTAGVVANTVYTGYAPASSLTLHATVTGGTLPYGYSWSANGDTTSSLTVIPATQTNYTVTVTDANGCTASAVKVVDVINVSGEKLPGKVRICHNYMTLEVAAAAVEEHLAHGDMLGNCTDIIVSGGSGLVRDEITAAKKLSVTILPNPSHSHFIFVTRSVSNEVITVTVLEATGRVMEKKTVPSNGTFTLGTTYRPGVYYAIITQGTERIRLKLIRQ